ncbi:SLBB domain-containing protein [Elioraea sp.]|uniref:SLBB domain-containing protein n=1 Tax=Elioraea sp. TaxID=2185103 RepID=UPI002629A38D|nr:SLBB domain-containing protein [Elioraea sp.]
MTVRPAAAVLAMLLAAEAAAQAPPPAPLSPPPLPGLPQGVPLEVLQRMLDAAGGPTPAPRPPSAGDRVPLPVRPGDAPVESPIAAPPTEPDSPVEAFYAPRLPPGAPRLRQFGYDTFAALPAGGPGAVGALPDAYVLGPDDEIFVTLRGRVARTIAARIDRDGRLMLPDLAPIPAAGRRLGELRGELAARLARELPGTEAFVAVGAVRQMQVFVAGEVLRPGFQALTSLASVLDALAAAGGVKRTGSLRAIRVEGPAGARRVDLYGVLSGHGDAPDLSLAAGDRIVVPPLGGTVAIAGEVGRPAIYELPPAVPVLPLREALALAGETLRPQGMRFLLQQFDAAGRSSFAEIAPDRALRRGDLVMVLPSLAALVGQVRLSGHVRLAQTRSRGAAPTLRRLIGDPRQILPDPYLRFAALVRVDPATRLRRIHPVDLGRVLAGRADVTLADEDELVLLGRAEIAWLSGPAVQRVLRGEPQPAEDCPALAQLAVLAAGSPERFANVTGLGVIEAGPVACPRLFVEHPDLAAAALESAVLMTGEVRRPGVYPLAEEATLADLLAVAGGPTENADLRNVEVTRVVRVEGASAAPVERFLLDIDSRNFAAVRVAPRDSVRFARLFIDRDTGPVRLAGEFVRPGVYDIRRGERLSELIQRAGGLTREAYPYGAVFTRESVRLRQQEGFERTARELETSLLQVAAGRAVSAPAGRNAVDLGDAIRAGRELAASLREARAAGRMVVEANPAVLAARPELDLLLEPGDVLVVPKRPNDVSVVGAVLNPGALQFRSGRRASDYVEAAGGPQRFADIARAFVVLPNGQTQPAGLSSWSFSPEPIPPGSLVVVPQDPSPFETWGFIRDLTQLLSQISISAAALAVIARETR